MSPLRTESSTVSLPPRERMLAKRRAKAIRKGLPIPRHGANSAKQKGKAPTLTLAATRERRLTALNVAYIDRPDGYHIKRVVRRPATPKRAPPVPYLPGQEDIPRSDDDSDNDSNIDGSSTTATVLELALPTTSLDTDIYMDDAHPELFSTEPEELDYDAEGETDDEVMNDVTLPRQAPLANYAPDIAWGPTPNLVPQMWPGGSEKTNDLIGNASEEDLRDLFAGLANLPADFPDEIPTDFPSTQDLAADIQESGPFAMHQLHTAVDNLYGYGLSHQHSHNGWVANQPTQPSVNTSHSQLSTSRSPPIMSSQAATPTAPSGSVHNPFAHLSPPTQHAAQPAPGNGTPIGTLRPSPCPLPVNPTPRSNTRDRVAQARAQARPPSLVIPQPAPIPAAGLLAGPLLRRPPLRRSLNLPSFLGGEDDDDSLDEDPARPSTPVALDETDVGLNDSSPAPVTQARSRAARYFNVRVLPRHASRGSLRIPTVAELQLNASRVYRINRRRARNRNTTTTQSARGRKTLSSGELSDNQRAVISQMEYHVMKDVVCVNPWPELEQRQEFLWGAQQYAIGLTGISSDEVFSQKFLDTVFYRTSANRGNSLAKIEFMVEEKFGVGTTDKRMLYQLMEKDQFLFPTKDCEPDSYFCVEAIGTALEIILFKSSKPIGVAFMEDLCKPDEPTSWHKNLCDKEARKGVPPALLAFAAAQMYWALEKLYMGSTVNFDEQHYRGVWNRYFRALIKLPHLGRLRIDMLNRLKEYYIAHWPGEEPDEDEPSFPAW